MGARFIKNEIFRKLSLLLGRTLYLPPNLVDLRLTLRCNLRCKQCPEWKIRHSRELPEEIWKKIIIDIKKCTGPYFLRFYGGEPFMRKDFLSLIRFCSQNEIISLITTNGTLIDSGIAKELARNNIALINISLDGFKEATHDRLRGIDGAHKKAMKAINYLQGKIPLQINATIMDDNIDEILDLVDFAGKNKLQISLQGLINMLGDGKPINNLCKDNSLFVKDPGKLDYLIGELIKKKKHGKALINSDFQIKRLKYYYHRSPQLKKKSCETLGNHMYIRENGNLVLCIFRNRAIGNLSRSPLRDIWRSNPARQEMYQMRQCRETKCTIFRGHYKESYSEIFGKVQRAIHKLI